tara:strand:+ start:631 stop:1440 length:810 start_codon:yes stop_codon:yes gene_type:complete
MSCYKLEKFKYNNSIFSKSIDATYIIHLEGNNNRYNNIVNQLKKFKPTNIVYILYNKGWNNCVKDKYITNTSKDLIDCNINIFQHANKNNYNNILILEDDFIFDSKINQTNNINNINKFLLKKINKSFTFYLGTIPFLFIPYNFNIYKGLINIYTHSVVFSKKYRNEVLKYNYKDINCWDLFQNYYNKNKYYYNIPLCYQLVEKTDNSNNWNMPKKIKSFYLNFAYLFDAHNNPSKFFYIFYIISYLIIFIITIICVIIIYKIKKMIII